MPRLSTADGQAFSAIKASCYCGLDSVALRQVVGERLRRHTEADAFAFLALDPGSGLPIHAVHDWPSGMCDVAHERAVLVSPAADFGPRGASPRRAYPLEQLVAGELRAADPYVRDVLDAFGYGHELQMTCSSGGRVWGNLHLTRRHGRPAFAPHSAALLEALAPHITAGLRAAVVRAALAAGPGTGVGVVVLAPGGGVELANGVAERLLRQSPAPGCQSYWVAIQIVAGLLNRALADEESDALPLLTVVDEERGESYRLRAERAVHADGRQRGVVFIEPARLLDGGQGLPLLGLTEREADVVRAVLRGELTEVIAAELVISPHTVQRHVQHIFEKLGVRSRRELGRLVEGSHEPHPPALELVARA
jgi:DNA-binding CsgD family transcriptional regulator